MTDTNTESQRLLLLITEQERWFTSLSKMSVALPPLIPMAAVVPIVYGSIFVRTVDNLGVNILTGLGSLVVAAVAHHLLHEAAKRNRAEADRLLVELDALRQAELEAWQGRQSARPRHGMVKRAAARVLRRLGARSRY